MQLQVVKGTTDETLIQPFKDDMEVYIADARTTVARIEEKLACQREAYIQLVTYFLFVPKRGVPAEDVAPGVCACVRMCDFFCRSWIEHFGKGKERTTIAKKRLGKR